jgi:hypothetical protein
MAVLGRYRFGGIHALLALLALLAMTLAGCAGSHPPVHAAIEPAAELHCGCDRDT